MGINNVLVVRPRPTRMEGKASDAATLLHNQASRASLRYEGVVAADELAWGTSALVEVHSSRQEGRKAGKRSASARICCCEVVSKLHGERS